MKEKYFPPTFMEKQFHCPKCGVYSAQLWKPALEMGTPTPQNMMGLVQTKNVFFSICAHCQERSIWLNTKMIDPSVGGIELPNEDLLQEIKDDYNEAAGIVNKSPRGAAALLRLAIQKLCTSLGEKGKNINEDISRLVEKGLPVRIQRALDYVRVIGNESVHPGQIDLKDNRETAVQLFGLINLVAEVMISQPKHVESLYNTLPADKLKAIEDRDKL